MARPLGSRYELTDPLAQGAVGAVWRAEVRQTGEAVAVKLLRAEFAGDPETVDRFLRERRVLAAVQHPAVVRMRDMVAEGDDLGIVMDLVDGIDLRRHLAMSGPLAPAAATHLAATIADALAAAHDAGVVHSDVKPANVLVPATGGPVRLADFGVARLARIAGGDGPSYGTPEYVAPEVVDGKPATPASDVYGLGIVLFEMLAGSSPYRGGAPAAVFVRHIEAEPDWLAITHPELRRINGWCLDPDPARRPTATQLATELRRWLPALVDIPAAAPLPAGTVLYRARGSGPAAAGPTNMLATALTPSAAEPGTDLAGPAVSGATERRDPLRGRQKVYVVMLAMVVGLGLLVAGLVASGTFARLPWTPAVRPNSPAAGPSAATTAPATPSRKPRSGVVPAKPSATPPSESSAQPPAETEPSAKPSDQPRDGPTDGPSSNPAGPDPTEPGGSPEIGAPFPPAASIGADVPR